MVMIKLNNILKQILLEKKADRCKRIADRKYDKPSAYKSGAMVRCRKGNIWKNLKELVTDTEVICDNCGWKWNIENGGDDLYICHKCGNDNNPIN
jgi:DNA-directed RNA polymerase subunit RPC12/RpoP